jgi:peptidoglycan-N-acetylglucosamine deacetylase
MIPDPSRFSKRSKLLTALVVIVALISAAVIYFYSNLKQSTFFTKDDVNKDSLAEVIQNKIAPKKKDKTIYLTFDDGPCTGSSTVMNILKQEQIQGSFFIVGLHVCKSSSQRIIYNEMKASKQFEIYNHSYSHALRNRFKYFYSQPNVVIHDFEQCADSTPFTTKIIRLPGRNTWRMETVNFTDIRASRPAADSLYKHGFLPMGWDLEWRFTNHSKLVQSEETMLNEIDTCFARNNTRIGNHLILLTHDRTFETPEDSARLHKFIKDLKRRDMYNFEVVSKYPILSKDTIGIPRTHVLN